MHLPSLDGGAEWLNSAPLAASELLGTVVLVDFWTLTCINWLRTQPYVRAWSRAYRDDGLVVLGVHTPEFSFEHDGDRVREALRVRQIDYPVVIDNDYAIWRAFDNHYWPALYVADAHGVVRHHQFGEGRYEQTERQLQRLLGVERSQVSVTGMGVEAAADWDHLRSPETYLGYLRGERLAAPDGVELDRRSRYAPPQRLELNEWALDGQWTINQDRVVLAEPGGTIAYRFHARDVHLVLNGTGQPIPFRVLVDDRPPGPAHGGDVDESGNGVLLDGRLYHLFREPGEVRERTVQITFDAPGAALYVFTFG